MLNNLCTNQIDSIPHQVSIWDNYIALDSLRRVSIAAWKLLQNQVCFTEIKIKMFRTLFIRFWNMHAFHFRLQLLVFWVHYTLIVLYPCMKLANDCRLIAFSYFMCELQKSFLFFQIKKCMKERHNYA